MTTAIVAVAGAALLFAAFGFAALSSGRPEQHTDCACWGGADSCTACPHRQDSDHD